MYFELASISFYLITLAVCTTFCAQKRTDVCCHTDFSNAYALGYFGSCFLLPIVPFRRRHPERLFCNFGEKVTLSRLIIKYKLASRGGFVAVRAAETHYDAHPQRQARKRFANAMGLRDLSPVPPQDTLRTSCSPDLPM